MSRRIVFAYLFVLGFSLFTAFASETQAPMAVAHALALTRTINTIEIVHFSKTGVYADRMALLDYLREKKDRIKASGQVVEWISRLNFSSGEILPGWFMDYEVKPGNTGYILILTGDEEQKTESDAKHKSVLITDEHVLNYRAHRTRLIDCLPHARSRMRKTSPGPSR